MPLLLGVLSLVHADDTLIHARHARALLGPDAWSRLIRIENTAPRSSYPRVLHALVFELAGRLWFYTSLDGTQSLSVDAGRLAADERDFVPLLRLIEPGFTQCRVLDSVASENAPHGSAPLPNGCLIESLAAWRERAALGGEGRDPRLFSYYIDTLEGRHGHTVLLYETSAGLQVFDPAMPSRRVTLSPSLMLHPRALAEAVENRPGVVIRRTWCLPLPTVRETA